MTCAFPEKQLFDWGMMRLRRPLYGVGDAFATEADDHFRKKRDAEVIYSTHDLFELFFDSVRILTRRILSFYLVSVKSRVAKRINELNRKQIGQTLLIRIRLVY